MVLEADEEGKADGLQDPLLIQRMLNLFQFYNLKNGVMKSGM